MYVDSRPALGRGPRKLPFGTDCASHPRVRHPKSKKGSGSNRRPKPPTSQGKLYGIWSRNELYRTSRPKNTKAFGKLVSVTSNRLTIQGANLCSRASIDRYSRRFARRQNSREFVFRNTSPLLLRAPQFCGGSCVFLQAGKH